MGVERGAPVLIAVAGHVGVSVVIDHDPVSRVKVAGPVKGVPLVNPVVVQFQDNDFPAAAEGFIGLAPVSPCQPALKLSPAT